MLYLVTNALFYFMHLLGFLFALDLAQHYGYQADKRMQKNCFDDVSAFNAISLSRGYSGVLANTHKSTCPTPDALRAVAISLAVAPVVITSSTIARCA